MVYKIKHLLDDHLANKIPDVWEQESDNQEESGPEMSQHWACINLIFNKYYQKIVYYSIYIKYHYQK